MDLQDVYNNQSHLKLLELVKVERHTLKEILTHLQKISAHFIFTKMGYDSLAKYSIKEHYS